MGKRIEVQRRGRGGLQFRFSSKNRLGAVKYPAVENGKTYSAVVEDIVHEKGRYAPLMKLKMDDGNYRLLPAPTGIAVRDRIYMGEDAPLRNGCILPLRKIPEGTIISNVERIHGDGGRYVKTAGTSAIVVAHVGDMVKLKMPSGKTMDASDEGMAMIGVIAGGGRKEKPFLTAGRRYYYMKARSKNYPTVRGIAMASVYHPHGGGRHQHPGKPTTVSRNAPPGRKVGNISARKTGRGY